MIWERPFHSTAVEPKTLWHSTHWRLTECWTGSSVQTKQSVFAGLRALYLPPSTTMQEFGDVA